MDGCPLYDHHHHNLISVLHVTWFLFFSPLQWLLVGGGPRCEHHLQQDPGPGSPATHHLPEPPERHHRDRRGRPDGHQRVPGAVPERPLELLRPGGAYGLRKRVESGYVALSVQFTFDHTVLVVVVVVVVGGGGGGGVVVLLPPYCHTHTSLYRL